MCDSGELVVFHFWVIRYVDTQRVYTTAAAAAASATTTTTTTAAAATTDLFLYFYQISSDGLLTTRP